MPNSSSDPEESLASGQDDLQSSKLVVGVVKIMEETLTKDLAPFQMTESAKKEVILEIPKFSIDDLSMTTNHPELRDFKLLKIVGKGGFAKVYLA